MLTLDLPGNDPLAADLPNVDKGGNLDRKIEENPWRVTAWISRRDSLDI
jgi:hypothetical protein